MCIFASYLNKLHMARCISSVSITLSPKSIYSMEPLITKVLILDYSVGATISHIINYINKNPLIVPYLNKYHILSLTFQYSEL